MERNGKVGKIGRNDKEKKEKNVKWRGERRGKKEERGISRKTINTNFAGRQQLTISAYRKQNILSVPGLYAAR